MAHLPMTQHAKAIALSSTATVIELEVVVVALVAVALLLVTLVMSRGNISGDEAKRLVGGGARLVDVRTTEEFERGHLPGAINVPIKELEIRWHEIGSKEATIIVYCKSGARSSYAQRLLKTMGFGVVHNLGAMARWS